MDVVPTHPTGSAVIVGINRYPYLQGADLQGCETDALAMAGALRRRGFETTLLTNNQASRSGILRALAALRSRKTDPFVFYFAGNGTRDGAGRPALLSADAREDSPENDLGQDDLLMAIRSVPSDTRTIFLDTGRGPNLSQVQSHRPALRNRYFYRPHPEAPLQRGYSDLPLSSDTDNSFWYVTACVDNEPAFEMPFGSTVRGVFTDVQGVFTHFLVQELDRKPLTWGDLQRSVCSHVADQTDDFQHPRIRRWADFSSVPVFGPGITPVSSALPSARIWPSLLTPHPDPEKVPLSFRPERPRAAPGEKLFLEVKVGTTGYLVVLEEGIDGSVTLLRPETLSVKVDQFRSQAGDIVELSTNEAGVLQLFAVLFTSADDARALLERFPASGHLRTSADLAGVSLALKRDAYTSQRVYRIFFSGPGMK